MKHLFVRILLKYYPKGPGNNMPELLLYITGHLACKGLIWIECM